MAKDLKDVEEFQISAIITNANQGKVVHSCVLQAKWLFFLFPHVWIKVPLSEQKQPDFTGFRLLMVAQAVKEQ